jgi:hypothetical protein
MSFKRLLQLCLGAAAFFSLIFQPFAFVAQDNTAAISGRVTIRGKPAAGKKVLVADLDTSWGTPRVASGSGTQGRKYLAAVTDAEG